MPRAYSKSEYSPWPAGSLCERLCEKARGMSFICVACGCVHCSEAFVEQKATAWQDGGAAWRRGIARYV